MLAQLTSLSQFGLQTEIVDIEVDLHRGLPKFSIVGLGDTAIQESKERIRSAIKNSGFEFPRGIITVNLAPADLKKQGPRFDVPIALGILHASGQIQLPENIQQSVILGELSFTGELRSVSGMLPTADGARHLGYHNLYVPEKSAHEGALIPDLNIYGTKDLPSLIDHFTERQVIKPKPTTVIETQLKSLSSEWDMSHIKGNEHAKRALEIAAAGSHNLLMCGPPGSGKTMLAQSISTILPKLTIDEALEITKIHSIAGLTTGLESVVNTRPFRTVHHTASSVAIVGGGNPPKPGEISLSHRGILFLDELPEFPKKTLEVLRQPLEDGVITISRASGSCMYPAQMMLVAAMNPTPCGYDESDPRCTSSPFEIQRYKNKLSGPLLDRIDLHITVPRIDFEKLKNLEPGENSATIQARVQIARDRQNKRYADTAISCNREMSSEMVRTYCVLDGQGLQLMKSAVERFDLSGRAYYRILKVARTIADLADRETIEAKDIAEAIQYRQES